MVRRTRDIQKKIWLTPQEERTIAKKMEMIGTENFGAYARKMLIDGYIIVVDYTEQKKLAAEINKIGVNINTVCRRLFFCFAFLYSCSAVQLSHLSHRALI